MKDSKAKCHTLPSVTWKCFLCKLRPEKRFMMTPHVYLKSYSKILVFLSFYFLTSKISLRKIKWSVKQREKLASVLWPEKQGCIFNRRLMSLGISRNLKTPRKPFWIRMIQQALLPAQAARLLSRTGTNARILWTTWRFIF